MKTRRCALAATLFTLGLVLGCGGDEGDNPFEGRWLREDGAVLVFGGDTWSDSQGDEGSYDFRDEALPPVAGDAVQPYVRICTVTFVGSRGTEVNRAFFPDTDTMELCELDASGARGACTLLVREDTLKPA